MTSRQQRGSSPSPGRVGLACALTVAVAVTACGGDDTGVDAPVTSNAPAEESATDGADDGAGVTTQAGDGYGLPADYPIPAPDGGAVVSSVFVEASGSSNVVISYPLEVLDALVQGYDAFFDTVEGETERVPLTDGLASWLNADAGYSVIVNGQNTDVQVRLQTGV